MEVKIIGGDCHGKTEFTPRIILSRTEDDANLSLKLKCCQFPVRLAFSITINKTRGQYVKRVGVGLRVPVFSHGQLYVTLSRVKNSLNVRVVLLAGQRDTRTTNVVYLEVLTGLTDEARNLLAVMRSLCSRSNLH